MSIYVPRSTTIFQEFYFSLTDLKSRDIERVHHHPKVVPRKIFIHLFSAKNNKLTTRVAGVLLGVVVVMVVAPLSFCVCWFCPLWCTPYLPLTQAATLVKHGQHKTKEKLIFCTIEAKTHAVDRHHTRRLSHYAGRAMNGRHTEWINRSTNLNPFFRHLNQDHAMDDKSHAQVRVQLQVVKQHEKQVFSVVLILIINTTKRTFWPDNKLKMGEHVFGLMLLLACVVLLLLTHTNIKLWLEIRSDFNSSKKKNVRPIWYGYLDDLDQPHNNESFDSVWIYF